MTRPDVLFALALGLALGCQVPAGPAEPVGPRTTAPATVPEARGARGPSPRIALPNRSPARRALAPRTTTLGTEHPEEPRRLEGRETEAAEGALFRSFVARDPALVAPPVRFGLLHAHTRFSDGSSVPADAFARARERGLDFIAITEHNHDRAEAGASGARRDGILIADTPALYDGEGPVTVTPSGEAAITVDSLIRAAESATTGDFVALYGQEFSTISSGNHLNVLGAEDVITIENGDFGALYEALAEAADAGSPTPVLQMNHPDVHDDFFYGGSNADTIAKMFDDYGFDDFGEDFAALVAAADPFVSLVEVLTGPAFATEPRERFHYGSSRMRERDYYFYLVQGFHLSPSVGHDNHFTTFGDATPARMGVLSQELTRSALLDAMSANRSFATEDADLELVLFGNGQLMGANLELEAGAPLVLTARVHDPTDPDTEYEVELLYADVQSQARGSLVEWHPRDGLQDAVVFVGDGEVAFEGFLASGAPEFFYVRVQQADGDRAWSAPIWVNHARP